MSEYDCEWLPDPTYAITLCDIMPSTKYPVNDEEIEVDIHISQGEIAQFEQYKMLRRAYRRIRFFVDSDIITKVVW